MDWIKITDELPPISTSKNLVRVLIICESIGITMGYYWGIENTKEIDPCKGWTNMGVTHWLPMTILPEIPKKINTSWRL